MKSMLGLSSLWQNIKYHTLKKLLRDKIRLVDRNINHGLNRPLIVSLTSYPPRFNFLADTIRSLLCQNTRSDITILWLAEGDMHLVPREVLDLQNYGLSIRTCEDMRSYKKLLPCLKVFPGRYIATADDDVFYGPDWLTHLVQAIEADRKVVPCLRGHMMKLNARGVPAPYSEWDHDVPGPLTSQLLFMTGVGGTLYPPGCFLPEVLSYDTANLYCPSADDVWFYWMLRMNDWTFKKVGPPYHPFSWPGSQRESLYSMNVHGGLNDNQIQAMCQAYGFPNPKHRT